MVSEINLNWAPLALLHYHPFSSDSIRLTLLETPAAIPEFATKIAFAKSSGPIKAKHVLSSVLTDIITVIVALYLFYLLQLQLYRLH